MTIDINCDMGEGILVNTAEGVRVADELIMPYISSANVACGAHAGNPMVIEQTIRLAVKHGVSLGAHPGFPDPIGFGRHPMVIAPEALRASLVDQIGLVREIAKSCGVRMHHVKPHGALYNMVASDNQLAQLLVEVVKEIDPELILFGLPDSAIERAAQTAHIQFAAEVFADRAYNDDGSLVDRRLPGAVLHDAEKIADRVVMMVHHGTVMAISGNPVYVRADTVCIHGDNPEAPGIAKVVSSHLTKHGILIKSMGRP
jgi:5-oxoprolinase (ATP-hydrolysing) subunit A